MNIIMELDVFILNFSQQFEETNSSLFSKDTEFKNLNEWDSLIVLNIIAMVDEEYGVSLRGNELNSAKTINDLYLIVKNKLDE